MSSTPHSVPSATRTASESIPDQLSDYSLIRVCSPSCSVHQDCDSPGKRPVSKVQDIESTEAVNRWVRNGGNAGIVPTKSDDLVVLDIDSDELQRAVREYLPQTFTVATSSGYHRYYRVPGWQKNHGWGEIGSLRANNWMAVIPPSTHPSGIQYSVDRDIPIASLSPRQIAQVVEDYATPSSMEASKGKQATSVGGVEDLNFILKDDIRSRIESYLHSSNPDHDDRLWLVGWLYNVPDDPNLSQRDIVNLIMRHARWDNLERDVVESQVESIVG